MRKRILACALVTTLVASMFTGCERRTTTRETSSFEADKIEFNTNLDINTEDKIELVVWESKDGPDNFIKEAGKYFEELYPNITITFKNVESNDANSKIALDGPAGVGADLFATAHNNAGGMAAANLIEPVPDSEKDIVKASCTDAAYQGATLFTSDGSETLYGYPVSVETYAIFYNRELISDEEVPTTMADLVQYIKDYDNGDTQPFLFDPSNAYYAVMFTSTDQIHLYGETGNDIHNTYMNSDESIAQMETDFVALAEAINQKAGDISYKNNDALFEKGQLAMDVSGAWNINVFEDAGIDFGITSIPSMTGSTTAPASFMGVRCMYVSKYSEHPTEAAAFAEFLMTKEMQQLRCEITQAMPARDDVVDLLNSKKYAKLKDYLNGLSKQLEYAYPMPGMQEAAYFWSAFGSAYTNIWNNKGDVKAELDMANEKATQ